MMAEEFGVPAWFEVRFAPPACSIDQIIIGIKEALAPLDCPEVAVPGTGRDAISGSQRHKQHGSRCRNELAQALRVTDCRALISPWNLPYDNGSETGNLDRMQRMRQFQRAFATVHDGKDVSSTGARSNRRVFLFEAPKIVRSGGAADEARKRVA
jgi:hypothetical protein